ncbi:DUF551 domain-containing protein [Raoultella ornithinolytica]|uniref:DUF551 domain-containing protein n=1 Tax=Raoultella ornithinolytica TaxID=54291 RepID=UPI001F411393|nr:DUF551 domain-containing protein [Raoultella ornithinolytica]
MTSKLTITREQATDKEIQMLIDSHENGTAMFLRVDAYYLMAKELQERRKAELDSKPVAWTDEEELRDANAGACGYLFGIDREANKFADPRRQIMLYRHAQPAPVVPDERAAFNAWNNEDNLPIAGVSAKNAAWLAWQARAAMLQHQPQNAQQNIPENIPGGLVEAVNNLLNNDGSRGCYDAMECGTAREKIELWLAQRQRWEEQRKANLSAGNSPVIPDGKSVTASTGIQMIPDGYVMVPKEPTESMINTWLSEVANWRGHVAGYKAMPAAAPQPQNAPQNIPEIIPGWIPVSERMPEMGEKQRYVLAADFKNNYWPNIPNTQVGVYGDWFDDGNPTWDDGDGNDLHLKQVTHWMPLPAAPQEVSNEK